jgi:NAD-dependent deacetylase
MAYNAGMDNRTSLNLAARWLRSAREVVVFTGAGMSAESGIPTFRDEGGLWQEFPPEEFATWHGLMHVTTASPRRVAEFLHALLEPIAAAKPNDGHLAIAALETQVHTVVVTQNIDGLHQEAGSTTVYEVHGSLLKIATRGGKFIKELSRREMLSVVAALDRARRGRFTLPRVLAAIRPLAGVGRRGVYRPRVVLFTDAMAEPDWSASVNAARHCDCLIQVGCSGMVYPAAMVPRDAKSAGARVIAIDPAECPADLWLPGTAATVLPALVQAAFGGKGES